LRDDYLPIGASLVDLVEDFRPPPFVEILTKYVTVFIVNASHV